MRRLVLIPLVFAIACTDAKHDPGSQGNEEQKYRNVADLPAENAAEKTPSNYPLDFNHGELVVEIVDFKVQLTPNTSADVYLDITLINTDGDFVELFNKKIATLKKGGENIISDQEARISKLKLNTKLYQLAGKDPKIRTSVFVSGSPATDTSDNSTYEDWIDFAPVDLFSVSKKPLIAKVNKSNSDNNRVVIKEGQINIFGAEVVFENQLSTENDIKPGDHLFCRGYNDESSGTWSLELYSDRALLNKNEEQKEYRYASKALQSDVNSQAITLKAKEKKKALLNVTLTEGTCTDKFTNQLSNIHADIDLEEGPQRSLGCCRKVKAVSK